MRAYLYSAFSILLLSCSTANTQRIGSTASAVAKVIPQDGINGAWILTLSTPRGKRSIDFTIEKTSETTATGTDKNGSFDILIDGSTLSFSRNMSTRMGNITSSFEGKIESDYQLSGTMSMDSGPASGKQLAWTAVRP